MENKSKLITSVQRESLNEKALLYNVFTSHAGGEHEQWMKSSIYLQKLICELLPEIIPLIEELEGKLDDEWDRFQEHRGEFVRSFLNQLTKFSHTSSDDPDQFYTSVRRITSLWTTLSSANVSSRSG
jgi:hypothetical protein